MYMVAIVAIRDQTKFGRRNWNRRHRIRLFSSFNWQWYFVVMLWRYGARRMHVVSVTRCHQIGGSSRCLGCIICRRLRWTIVVGHRTIDNTSRIEVRGIGEKCCRRFMAIMRSNLMEHRRQLRRLRQRLMVRRTEVLMTSRSGSSQLMVPELAGMWWLVMVLMVVLRRLRRMWRMGRLWLYVNIKNNCQLEPEEWKREKRPIKY